jgi:hypothetical protein
VDVLLGTDELSGEFIDRGEGGEILERGFAEAVTAKSVVISERTLPLAVA